MKIPLALALICLLVSAGSAFNAGPARSAFVVRSSPSKVSTFRMAKESEAEDIVTPDILPPSDETTRTVTEMNTGKVREVKWQDDAATANTNFELTYGWIFIIIPALIIGNVSQAFVGFESSCLHVNVMKSLEIRRMISALLRPHF